MLTKTVLSGLRVASAECRRNFGIMVPAMQKVSDPIQQLFLDKVREYKSKSKNDSFVDATPEIQAELKSELDRVAKQFGGGKGVDMTKFPDFKFQEPKLDPISIEKAA
ncbi:ATP synthase-coupling factor 6, mitochondrial [Sitodiplosis mosellana]|uniref:ATP synthase-coupling factor 6, mitochondrial n=1 Tax=Sitodiplosis mosellana TaxID=263140 RepID=UPI0024448AE0|nr:ATP synthase-coupling factor 6, mitochondrial [Sitodiplosis mosellana]XP_055324078.1 ATP synthase-coupling factor 6, mitochondrial [Sitodiplosis mosellana]